MSSNLGWWVISGEELLDLLRRCHAGEDPDLVYAEAYANTEIDRKREEEPVSKDLDKINTSAALWIDPARRVGKVCIYGHRIDTAHTAMHFMAGTTIDGYRHDYALYDVPDRTIIVAIAWWVLREKATCREDRRAKKAWREWAERTWELAWSTSSQLELPPPLDSP